ncbi:uncharacterized protein [Apostichopus japonicus]
MMPSISQLAEVLSDDDIEQMKEEIYNMVLDKHFSLLCRNIIPRRHFAILREKNVFTQSIEEEILANVTTEQQVRRFIDELKRRGTSAFPAFIASIDKTQVDLKRKLNKSCEALLEDVPASILETVPNLDLNIFRMPEGVVGGAQNQQEYFPQVDVERLKEAQDIYNKNPAEEEEDEEEVEYELVDTIVPLPTLQEPRMNQL